MSKGKLSDEYDGAIFSSYHNFSDKIDILRDKLKDSVDGKMVKWWKTQVSKTLKLLWENLIPAVKI